MEFNLKFIENLSQLHASGVVHQKQLFLRSILKEKLVFENNEYRTIPCNEVITLIMNVDKALGLPINKKARL